MLLVLVMGRQWHYEEIFGLCVSLEGIDRQKHMLVMLFSMCYTCHILIELHVKSDKSKRKACN